MASHPQLFNQAGAVQIANLLLANPRVKEVWLFGSIARNGEGNDFDIIIVPKDDRDAEAWFVSVAPTSAESREEYLYSASRLRLWAALGIFGDIINRVDERAPYAIDAFVFPANWKSRLDELQRRLPHEDPAFMENIARDAIQIV